MSKMTVKGLRLSTLCSFILELRRRPVVRRPLSALVACRCRPLPSVCSIICHLLTSRRQPPPPRATTSPPTLSLRPLPPPALSRRSLLVAPYTARSCHRQPLFLVLLNDTAPPLLRLLLCALVGLVDRAIRCGSIRGRRRFVRSSSQAEKIVVLLLLRSLLII